MQAESGAFWTRFSETRISEVTGRWDKGREGRKGTSHPSALEPSPPAVQHIHWGFPRIWAGQRKLFQLGLLAQKARPFESYTHIHTKYPSNSKLPHLLVCGSQQCCRSPLLNCPMMVSRITASPREEGISTGPQLRPPSAHFSQEE